MKNNDCIRNQRCGCMDEPLDDLVGRICETYSDGNGINHHEGCNLPRESEVLHILQNLLEIIFPGFADRVPQSTANLKYMVGEILACCREELCDTVARAFRCNCQVFNRPGCSCMDAAADAVTYLLNTIPEIRTLVKQDVQAAFDGDPAAKTLDEIVLSYPGVKALTIHRLAHCLYEKKVPLIPRMMSEYAHRITGIDIHPGATIGRSVFIDHGTGVVIGETAEIGSGVKIYQGVTLGALSFPKDSLGKIIKGNKRHPTIEDDVTIYAGATILGAVTIGKGSVIGGNVWITENVEPGTRISIAPPQLTIFKPAPKTSQWDVLSEDKRGAMLDSARKVFREALGVRKNETILLIYDKPTENVGRAFILAADMLGLSLTPRMIEITSGNGADPDLETIAMMSKHNIVIAATHYSLTHCAAMTAARKNYGIRGCTLPGITDDLFVRSMQVSPKTLQSDGQRWKERLKGVRKIRIVTEKGTDLTFGIGKFPIWVDDADFRSAGCVGNIPAGEVFMVPDDGTAQGRIVADASIASMPWKENDPDCIIDIKKGAAVGFQSERGQQLKEMLAAAGSKGFVVAEFGIGTNSVLQISGNLLEDEKVKGTIHIAFGNSASMGGNNDVPVHIDCMVRQPDVFADGKLVMKKGVWKV